MEIITKQMTVLVFVIIFMSLISLKIHIKVLKKLNLNRKSIILNCGYGIGISVLEVINEFKKQIKKKLLLFTKKKRKGDMEHIISITLKLRIT